MCVIYLGSSQYPILQIHILVGIFIIFVKKNSKFILSLFVLDMPSYTIQSPIFQLEIYCCCCFFAPYQTFIKILLLIHKIGLKAFTHKFQNLQRMKWMNMVGVPYINFKKFRSIFESSYVEEWFFQILKLQLKSC